MQPEFCGFEKAETRIQEPVSKRLSVVSRLPFIQEQLFALFDLIPGLEYCDVQRDPHTNSGKLKYKRILSFFSEGNPL